MTDEELINIVASAEEERRHMVAMLGDIAKAGKTELERRIKERRVANPTAKAIPHAQFKIELEEEFSPYTCDVELLAQAKVLLPDDEGAKILKHVSEQVTIVPAHDEPGSIASIKSLRDRYAGTAVGELLEQAIRRERTGERLLFELRKGAK
jgi:hypothetical protein